MKSLIRKILKEEFQSSNTMSSEQNICDIMTANSWSDIESLLKKMDSVIKDENLKKQIKDLYNQSKNELSKQGNDKDIINSYLRKIQNIICK
jgi:uncharacterized protein (UPF0147 family)